MEKAYIILYGAEAMFWLDWGSIDISCAAEYSVCSVLARRKMTLHGVRHEKYKGGKCIVNSGSSSTVLVLPELQVPGYKGSESRLFARVPAEEYLWNKKKGAIVSINLGLSGQFLRDLNSKGNVVVDAPYVKLKLIRHKTGSLNLTITKIDPKTGNKEELLKIQNAQRIELPSKFHKFKHALDAALKRASLPLGETGAMCFYSQKQI